MAAFDTKQKEFHELLYKATGSDAFLVLISHLIDKIRWLVAMAVCLTDRPNRSIGGPTAE
jgi:hypothetical protein